MMGMQSKKCLISLNGKPNCDLSNELDIFYNHFNVQNAVSEQNSVLFHRGRVLKLFWAVKERKSPGPDGIGGHILISCAKRLADIFCFIFKLSLQLHRVPCVWKYSIVPAPQNNSPESLNDYRPVTLTSLVMKLLEKIVKDDLLKHSAGKFGSASVCL